MLAIALLIRFFKTLRDIAEGLFWAALAVFTLIIIFIITIGIRIHRDLWPIFITILWVGADAVMALIGAGVLFLIGYAIYRRGRAARGVPLRPGIIREELSDASSSLVESRAMAFMLAVVLWWYHRRFIVHLVVLVWILVTCWSWMHIILFIVGAMMAVAIILYFVLRWMGRVPEVVSETIVPIVVHIPLAIRTQWMWHRLMRNWFIAQPQQGIILRHPQQGSRRTHTVHGRAFPTPAGAGVIWRYPSGISEENFTTVNEDYSPRMTPKDGIARDLGCGGSRIESNGRTGVLWLIRRSSPLLFVP
jgi:hypothetical protein